MQTDTNPARPCYVALPLALLTAACFLTAFLAVNPGLMSYDSLQTWRISDGSAPLTNAHPVAYILLLQTLRWLWDSPAVMVAFNIGVFSLGSLLLAETIRRRKPWLGYLLPLVLLLPFILNFIGVLWKDTTLAVCWWTAACIAIYACDHPSQRTARHILMALAYVVFAYGLLVRHNAVTAAPFVLTALVLLHLAQLPTIRKALMIFLLSCMASLSTLKVSTAIIDQVYEVRKIDMFTDLILYDLAGITRNSGTNAFGVDFTDQELQQAMQCYVLTDWNAYADPEKCLFVMNRHTDAGWYTNGQPLRTWMQAIRHHPLAYAEHRLNVFGSFLRIGTESSYWARYPGIDNNDLGIVHPQQPLFQAFQHYIGSVEDAFFMRPWFWLLLNIIAIPILWRRRAGAIDVAAGAVALGGTTYIMTYLIFGIASDFRYAYWAIMAALFAWAMIAAPIRSDPDDATAWQNTVLHS
ncbi:hypothetical protein LKR43_15280 [Pusillimonas sp. MFBS29]|uniref:hypothetical protein n=1 Tax=Pusillimonas sp. MFBS29 TaxID=2886690 RepID=UPI001D0FDEF1|nr:hypothetical protein [Pusillimonas sp. MFBS29]MCC2597696.1 hypothetical protein [Pusillimonas sp. MFBS29]